jgi:hypothetical protein
LPAELPALAPFERGEAFAAAWRLLTATPTGRRTRQDLVFACSSVRSDGAAAVTAVLPGPGTSYLVRSTQPAEHDVLAELRTWPMPDASLVVAWRVLKTWPSPPLE